jgi:hypothetical protein
MGRIKFLFPFLLLSFSGIKAIPLGLIKSNIIVLSEKVYFFGYAEEEKKTVFRCISYNASLVPLDSFSYELGIGKAESFHEIGIDTTHGFLNFWFQKKDNDKSGVYLRLNTKCRKVYVNEDAEATRINTQFVFDDDKIHYHNRIYVIRSPRDSIHKFFLSCYELKDDHAFFDYEIKWGFRFYKFNYLRCKLLYADNEKVMVYVHALDGEKKGQYILSISATNGELISAAQFNDEKSPAQVSYFISKFKFIPQRKEYFATGIATKAGEEASLLSIKKSPQLFLIALDEKGEVKYRINDLAYLPAAALKSKDMKFVCVRVKEINVTETGDIQIISEVAGSADGKKFRVHGYWLVSFAYLDGAKTINVNEYYNLIDDKSQKLISRNANDINGVFAIKSASENDKTMFIENNQDILVSAKAEGTVLKFIVRKKDLGAKKTIFSELKMMPAGKIEIKPVYEAPADESPICLPIDRTNAIIFAKSKKDGLIFKKVSW